LLEGELLEWPAFAAIQERYTAAGSEAERRELARSFARLVNDAQQELERRRNGKSSDSTTAGASARAELAATLAKLGKPGGVAQLLRFFPEFLRHPKGPLFGEPFKLAGF